MRPQPRVIRSSGKSSNFQEPTFMGEKRLAPKCHGLAMEQTATCGLGNEKGDCHVDYKCSVCGFTVGTEWPT
jgi:hypothetical protein